MQELPGLMKGYLKSARLTLGGDNVLMVVLEDEMAASYLNMEEHKRVRRCHRKTGRESGRCQDTVKRDKSSV